jgi:hypothetical protein
MFHIGPRDKFDESKGQALKPGSYVHVPKEDSSLLGQSRCGQSAPRCLAWRYCLRKCHRRSAQEVSYTSSIILPVDLATHATPGAADGSGKNFIGTWSSMAIRLDIAGIEPPGASEVRGSGHGARRRARRRCRVRGSPGVPPARVDLGTALISPPCPA